MQNLPKIVINLYSAFSESNNVNLQQNIGNFTVAVQCDYSAQAEITNGYAEGPPWTDLIAPSSGSKMKLKRSKRMKLLSMIRARDTMDQCVPFIVFSRSVARPNLQWRPIKSIMCKSRGKSVR